MNHSQKPLEKEAKLRSGAKSYKYDRSWRLLVVGDHGSIIPFGRIKGLFISLVATLIVSFAAACVLGFFYLNQKRQLDVLKEQLLAAQKQSAGLKDERDVLMAKLVITESNLKPKAITPTENPSPKASSQETPPPAPPAPQAAQGVEKPGAQPALSPVTESQPTKAEKVAPESPAPTPWSVAVENFRLSHDVRRNRLTAQFRIKNTTPGSVRIAGKCVLVLKGKDRGSPQALALPHVALANGEPSGTEGQSFRIWRFFDLSLKNSNLPDWFSFDQGTLYVFSDKGELILKQDVPVNLSYAKEPSPPAAGHKEGEIKPSDIAIPEKTPSSAILPQEPGSAGQASDQTPAPPTVLEPPEPAPKTPAPGASGIEAPNATEPSVGEEEPQEPEITEPSKPPEAIAPGQAPEN